MMDSIYFRQAELVLRVLPLVDREAAFALKGGTAINFFVRDFPRLSVDIDLVYLPVAEREESLRALCAALVRIAHEVETRIPGAKITPSDSKGRTFGAAARCGAGKRPSRSSRTWSCVARSSPRNAGSSPPRLGALLNSPWSAAPLRSRNSTRESFAPPWTASTRGTSSTYCFFSGRRF